MDTVVAALPPFRILKVVVPFRTAFSRARLAVPLEIFPAFVPTLAPASTVRVVDGVPNMTEPSLSATLRDPAETAFTVILEDPPTIRSYRFTAVSGVFSSRTPAFKTTSRVEAYTVSPAAELFAVAFALVVTVLRSPEIASTTALVNTLPVLSDTMSPTLRVVATAKVMVDPPSVQVPAASAAGTLLLPSADSCSIVTCPWLIVIPPAYPAGALSLVTTRVPPPNLIRLPGPLISAPETTAPVPTINVLTAPFRLTLPASSKADLPPTLDPLFTETSESDVPPKTSPAIW